MKNTPKLDNSFLSISRNKDNQIDNTESNFGKSTNSITASMFKESFNNTNKTKTITNTNHTTNNKEKDSFISIKNNNLEGNNEDTSTNDNYKQELLFAITINSYIKKIQKCYRQFKQLSKKEFTSKSLKSIKSEVKKQTKNYFVKDNNYNSSMTRSLKNSYQNYRLTNESQSNFNINEDVKLPMLSGKKGKNELLYSKNNIKDNSTNGFGIQIWQDSAKYVGMYNNDMANGFGIFYHVDGDIYKGEFKNDRADGYALYYYLNGAQYEGYWKEDVQNGIGIERWKDNSFYEGEYSKGKKCGIGKYNWADGSYYEGYWKDNNIDGEGIYLFSDGRMYKGEWKCNMMNGFGTFHWGNEKVYCGKFTLHIIKLHIYYIFIIKDFLRRI